MTLFLVIITKIMSLSFYFFHPHPIFITAKHPFITAHIRSSLHVKTCPAWILLNGIVLYIKYT